MEAFATTVGNILSTGGMDEALVYVRSFEASDPARFSLGMCSLAVTRGDTDEALSHAERAARGNLDQRLERHRQDDRGRYGRNIGRRLEPGHDKGKGANSESQLLCHAESQRPRAPASPPV